MSAKIIDGKKLAGEIRQNLKREIEEFKKTGGTVGLAVVLCGNDPASQVYVRNKISGCEEVGIKSFAYRFDENVQESELLELIETLNEDKNVDGILVQLPLPKHLDEQRILDSINYRKDVDGFLPMNAGKLMIGEDALMACTPSGCIELIKSCGVEIAGKNAVVVGRSNIVGKPVAMMLLKENATVTICHSKTQNLAEITKQADILVVAIGRANFVTGNMVKDGAVVIDVGMNRVDGKLCGDVEFESASQNASFITPVPGGVGPMTITMLLSNTLKSAKNFNSKK